MSVCGLISHKTMSVHDVVGSEGYSISTFQGYR